MCPRKPGGSAMVKGFAAFLVRCWRLEGNARRIEVEHIGSGGRMRSTSEAAALEWMCARAGDAVA